MPGKAWSSPVVMDNKVWFTNAEENGHKMWAIQLDWKSGRQLKKILIFENKTPQYCHPMNSYGTPTPVIYGNKVFVHFEVMAPPHSILKVEKNLGEKGFSVRSLSRCGPFTNRLPRYSDYSF